MQVNLYLMLEKLQKIIHLKQALLQIIRVELNNKILSIKLNNKILSIRCKSLVGGLKLVSGFIYLQNFNFKDIYK